MWYKKNPKILKTNMKTFLALKRIFTRTVMFFFMLPTRGRIDSHLVRFISLHCLIYKVHIVGCDVGCITYPEESRPINLPFPIQLVKTFFKFFHFFVTFLNTPPCVSTFCFLWALDKPLHSYIVKLHLIKTKPLRSVL